jgi:hypothetical protein
MYELVAAPGIPKGACQLARYGPIAMCNSRGQRLGRLAGESLLPAARVLLIILGRCGAKGGVG